MVPPNSFLLNLVTDIMLHVYYRNIYLLHKRSAAPVGKLGITVSLQLMFLCMHMNPLVWSVLAHGPYL